MKYQIEKDKMQGIPETMLQTLYARAQESEKPDRHIYDEKAIAIVSELDYDFSKAADDKMAVRDAGSMWQNMAISFWIAQSWQSR